MTDLVATLAVDVPEGTYQLRRDRCVVEVAVRVLGLPVRRRRVKAGGGTLTVGEQSTLELAVGSLPGLSAGLVLQARTVFSDDETVVLTASGPVRRRWLTLAAEFTR
jgi:hypothetical protein